MAIKITVPVQTSEGQTSTLYFNITEYYRNKTGSTCQFPVDYYTDETKSTPCEIFEGDLKKKYLLDLSNVVGTNKIEKLAYDKIGASLKAAGLSPQSDETGTWTNY
jgi:hypothetical protein